MHSLKKWWRKGRKIGIPKIYYNFHIRQPASNTRRSSLLFKMQSGKRKKFNKKFAFRLIVHVANTVMFSHFVMGIHWMVCVCICVCVCMMCVSGLGGVHSDIWHIIKEEEPQAPPHVAGNFVFCSSTSTNFVNSPRTQLLTCHNKTSNSNSRGKWIGAAAHCRRKHH